MAAERPATASAPNSPSQTPAHAGAPTTWAMNPARPSTTPSATMTQTRAPKAPPKVTRTGRIIPPRMLTPSALDERCAT